MSASAELQELVAAHLEAEGSLRVAVPVVRRRTKEIESEIEAAVANQGLCLYVWPPLPKRALQGLDAPFFTHAEVRVRILEKPAINETGVDAYDLLDDVCAALHWQLFGTICSHPLELGEHPIDMLDALDERDRSPLRVVDVIFNAVYGLQRGPQAWPPVTDQALLLLGLFPA